MNLPMFSNQFLFTELRKKCNFPIADSFVWKESLKKKCCWLKLYVMVNVSDWYEQVAHALYGCLDLAFVWGEPFFVEWPHAIYFFMCNVHG